MPRFKLTIEYDGTRYSGWQRQENGRSIQQAVETALAAVHGGGEITVNGAGRTDAGVHALGQVAHVDLPKDWEPQRLREGVNARLRGESVTVLEIERADDDFDARRHAVMRGYVYRILNRRAPPAVDRNFVWHVKRPLDAEAMHVAAQVMLGKHDFSTFRDSQCQANSPIRTLSALAVTRDGDRVDVEVAALSFLHRQVRSMVGSIAKVGLGDWSATELADALAAADRSRCAQVAPASGLFLARVEYSTLSKTQRSVEIRREHLAARPTAHKGSR